MTQQGITRRQMLQKSTTAGMATVAAVPLGPRPVNPSVRIGLVGCGGRGTGAVAAMLQGREDVELVSMGDIFQSQIDEHLQALHDYKTRDKQSLQGIKVKPDTCFTGVNAYKRVIDSDIDVVLLVTPPYCRPDHVEYAVKAGKHVFIEKPCATDVAGINRLLALEDEINRKGLNVIAGFERHHVPFMQEARERLLKGDIGKMTTGFAYFNTNDIWYRERKPGMTEQEYWFYNWYHVDWMCGDHLVEQAVHSADVINWMFDEVPVKAYGMGGRQFHTERGGNIYDHFAVEYEYPSGRRMVLQARQITGTDGKFGEDIIGADGQASLTYTGGVKITGKNPWNSGEPLKGNAQHQFEADYITDCVRENRRVNELRGICNSTMTAILGREAAYTGKELTWDELMATNHKLVPDNLEAWDGTLNPIPKPGMKRF